MKNVTTFGSVADPEGRGPTSTPVKTSQEKDGRPTMSQVSRVIASPLEQIFGSSTVVHCKTWEDILKLGSDMVCV